MMYVILYYTTRPRNNIQRVESTVLLSRCIIIPIAPSHTQTRIRMQQLAGNGKITRYVPRIANDVSPNLAKCIETKTM